MELRNTPNSLHVNNRFFFQFRTNEFKEGACAGETRVLGISGKSEILINQM